MKISIGHITIWFWIFLILTKFLPKGIFNKMTVITSHQRDVAIFSIGTCTSRFCVPYRVIYHPTSMMRLAFLLLIHNDLFTPDICNWMIITERSIFSSKSSWQSNMKSRVCIYIIYIEREVGDSMIANFGDQHLQKKHMQLALAKDVCLIIQNLGKKNFHTLKCQ